MRSLKASGAGGLTVSPTNDDCDESKATFEAGSVALWPTANSRTTPRTVTRNLAASESVGTIEDGIVEGVVRGGVGVREPRRPAPDSGSDAVELDPEDADG